MSFNNNDSKSKKTFIDNLAEIVYHFVSSNSKISVVDCLSQSDIVDSFCSSSFEKVNKYHFFFLSEHLENRQSNLVVVDTINKLPQDATFFIYIYRKFQLLKADESNNSPLEPISIKDIFFQNVSLTSPLKELNDTLISIYEPLTRTSIHNNIISNQINELISTIRSNVSFWIDFKISNYIHPDILKVCETYPNYSIPQIIEELGAKANDNTFLNSVQSYRSRCINVFDFDIYLHEVKSIREEISYWQQLDAWMDNVKIQLKSREWQLVQSLLSRRGADASVEKAFADKKALVTDYYRFLSNIPYQQIFSANLEHFPNIIRNIFEQLSRPQKFPPARLMKVADVIVKEICNRLIDITKQRSILDLNPGESLDFLSCIRAILNETQNGYIQTKDLRVGGVLHTDIQKSIGQFFTRIQILQDFINNHFTLLDSIRNIFNDNHLFTIKLKKLYEEVSLSSSYLWDFNKEDFINSLSIYHNKLSKLDEEIANLVKIKLEEAKTTEEIFRIHEKFQRIRRDKIKLILNNKHEELIQMIGHNIESIKNFYFSEAFCKKAVRMGVSKGHTPFVALIKWYKSLEQSLNEQLKRRDAVSKFGWQQLLSLQTIDFQWILNEQLALFLGYSISELTQDTRIKMALPEIYGTAFALAFLELLYTDERIDWESNINIRTARQILEKKDSQAFIIAKNFFIKNGLGARQITKHDKSREFRLFKEKIVTDSKEHVQKWCNNVRSIMVHYNFDTQNRLINGKLFRIIGKKLDVNFPKEMSALSIDLKFLMSYDLIKRSVSSFDDVRMFLDNNESKINIASTISQLLEKFYERKEMDEESDIGELLFKEYGIIYKILIDGMKLRWNALALIESFTERFTTAINDFCNISEDVKQITDDIDSILFVMEHDTNDPQKISFHISEIKKLINNLVIKASNTVPFLSRLQHRVDDILMLHLKNIVLTWIEEFNLLNNDPVYFENLEKLTPKYKLSALKVTLRMIKDDVKFDSVPMQWRSFWYDCFNKAIEWINHIPSFDSAFGANVSFKNQSCVYSRIIEKLPEGVLRYVYNAIETIIQRALSYEERWRVNQKFYNQNISSSFALLGNDMQKWYDALKEIRYDASEMNVAKSLISFGGIIIDSSDAQNRLSTRLDNIMQSFEKKFRDVAATKFLDSYNHILKDREVIESRNIESNIEDAIKLLSDLPNYQLHIDIVKEDLPQLQMVENALKSSVTFQSNTNWISMERLLSEYTTVSILLEEKKAMIERRRSDLEQFVRERVFSIDSKIKSLEKEYRQANISESDTDPREALRQIDHYFTIASNAEKMLKEVQIAQRALNEEPMISSKLESILADLQGQKMAYGSVKELYDEIDQLKLLRFTEIQPRNIQQSLYALQEKMLNFNPAVRHFSAYAKLDAYLKELTSCHRFIQDLRSDAMLDRHWVALKTQLKLANWKISNLTLGDIWDSKPTVNTKVYLAILENAHGQHRLQMQIDHIAEFWNNHPLEVTFFQNRVILIKGWDMLFEKLTEDINSLSAMKLSPHFADNIASAANDWEEKLNRARQILEMLVDVQRRWVYLDGIFSGSAEIRQQLPAEASQFDITSKKFILLMPRTKGESLTILKMINVDKILNTLEKIARELSLVQKTLGDYLENQRNRFPRFFFVGDDDLLEIIGNGKDPILVAKHLKKMFYGISSITVEFSKEKNSSKVLSMISPEGEIVCFHTPFEVSGMAVYEWLSLLEKSMCLTLSNFVSSCLETIPKQDVNFSSWLSLFPAQLVAVCIQINWVRQVEALLVANKDVRGVTKSLNIMLEQLATDVLSSEMPFMSRHKAEQIITVAVYQRDVTRKLVKKGINDSKHYDWLSTMRPYYKSSNEKDNSIICCMADTSFNYSFEYLGLAERLVQTCLTDKCFLTLTQALHTRLGGSPYGPAGTGKTETVKALGMQLGRFVLVFNCDETFDFKSMGRIFMGLCQVGAWGCFDEFNRLEERILSAVSQQIQTIQEGLKSKSTEIILSEKHVLINYNMGVFITMNPGYAGRSNLPDNLKQLFRPVAMTSPDRENIAEVLLFAQGFKTAESISRKIVPLFRLCKDQLSQQTHYDFGLRALKSVLISAGALKRKVFEKENKALTDEDEIRLIMQSLTETIVPKLIAEDVDLFYPLLHDVFPGYESKDFPLDELKTAIKDYALKHNYVASDIWMAKIVQLYKILHVNHGIMLVGPSGCAKTSAWITLLHALAEIEDIDGHAYIIDPKAVTKGELYGVLDPTTREWKDGIFTCILRRIIDNVKEDDQTKKRHWIIFDGDVDPEWVENLNSLLDDNKLLTLPNGERLTLPCNVRIIFEVQDLRYATPATVSRCGMVWFSRDTITLRNLLEHTVKDFCSKPFNESESQSFIYAERASLAQQRLQKRRAEGKGDLKEYCVKEKNLIAIQNKIARVAEEFFIPNGIVEQTLLKVEESYSTYGIMEYNRVQSVRSFFALFAYSAYMIQQYKETSDKELNDEQFRNFVSRRIVQSMLWGFASQYSTLRREDFAEELKADVPKDSSLLEYEVRVEDGEWVKLQNRVVKTEIPAQKVGTNDIVIPTVDTARHEDIITSWLFKGKPVILCGPPGSGKTMSLTAVLRSSGQYEAAFLNFSSGTTPYTITKLFDQYCTVKNSINGLIMSPISGKKLIVFCDEINLPSLDKYGTQRVVQFMRQLTERQGFYRSKDNAWVTVEDVQFVGACNPPTDPGRVPLTHRFLRWASVLFVDFPSYDSLISIYETYCRALLKRNLKLRSLSMNLSKAMVDTYKKNQDYFTPEIQRHYVYSPRELSRWSRAIFEGIESLDEGNQKSFTVEELVRLAVHEGLRLFRDRLTSETEGEWVDDTIDNCFKEQFPGLNPLTLQRPILYSTILTRSYTSSSRENLRVHIREKLKSFADEELDVDLVVFDAVVDNILRIDRVLRQPLGHILIVGSSGVGKKVLSRFVAWLNNLSVFQIKAHRDYLIQDFEEDLRGVMRRSGCKREKICFIFDESNIMHSSFLEYMNALLASGEVPGLFEGEEWVKLMHEIRDAVNAAGVSSFIDLTSEPDLYRWFVSNVQLYLHIVFTMNPHSPDFHSRSATSPALFNRCTINWFGDWSVETIFQVARELTGKVDVMQAFHGKVEDSDTAHDCLARCLCRIHTTTGNINEVIRVQSANSGTFITPRHFLDFIQHFHNLFRENRGTVEELQRHLNTGLTKLRETSELVDQQKRALFEKEKILAQSGKKAQEMLETIITETDKAKKAKEAALVLKETLERESNILGQERLKVETELANVEPALKEAENALNTIKPDNLREIRAYTTPPPTVKKVLEAVITLMGEKRAGDWEVIKSYTRRDDFISSIKAFTPSDITDECRERINKVFLSDESFTYENAQRASKAAGPLHKWLTAQVRYSVIFKNVEPLRIEIEKLSTTYESKLRQLKIAEKEIEEGELKISRLKENYQVTTAEASQIKREISIVATRCNRATALMEKLLTEKTRWENQSSNFKEQSAAVLGDCVLSSAFLAYIGYFDERSRRKVILPEWQDLVDEAQIPFRRGISIVEYLSKPEERLTWTACKIPQDTICIENAIIMTRYNRYPVIIDPSGQAVDFLLNLRKEKKITKTSFVDKGYMKQLEMAVRFGYPILIQDAEFIDPSLNPLLNKEVRRTGGRHLVRLGAQDIDISPTFQLYMSTRDSSFQFAPDVCGRTTMVNFTVTISSLQSQCLHSIMLHERPDMDAKRTELMKLQGEYALRLRLLENQLLTAISDSEGNILENDSLIQTLETLKNESSEIQQTLAQSELAYQEIEDVEVKYTPTAAAASKLYFSLQNLTELKTMYRFSLKFLYKVIKNSLESLPEEVCPDERIPLIIRNIFTLVHFRVTRSLFQVDHLAFELRLAQLRCGIKDAIGNQIGSSDWDLLFSQIHTASSGHRGTDDLPAVIPRTYTDTQLTQIIVLLSTTPFSPVKRSMTNEGNRKAWEAFFTGIEPLSSIPADAFGEPINAAKKAFYVLILCKVTRKDAMTAACEAFLETFFDKDEENREVVGVYEQKKFFMTQAGFSVQETITELGPDVPLLLVATGGVDAAGRVEDYARQKSVNLRTVAMGSLEGYEEANAFISQGVRLGTWVLLKNVHLASQFLTSVEKRIYADQLENRIHQNFRLFLSSEPSALLPPSLIEASILMVFEPPPGIKSSMVRTLGVIRDIPQYPKEIPRLFFIASWLHSVIIERMNYLPLGWSKRYEFSEADFRRMIDTINSWVQMTRGDRHNVPPTELPWVAMRHLIANSIYGGRIDNRYDQILIESFCASFLSPEAFDPRFNFISSSVSASKSDGLSIQCAGITMADFKAWVTELPSTQSPEWLGLPATATEMVLTQRADVSFEGLVKLQNPFIEDGGEEEGFAVPSKGKHGVASVTGRSKEEQKIARSRWAQRLLKSVSAWQELVSTIEFNPRLTNSTSPLTMTLKREAFLGENLLKRIRKDLSEVIDICKETLKPTNYHRTLIDALTKEIIPVTWNLYVMPTGITLNLWLVDFVSRLTNLQRLLSVPESKICSEKVNLGLLFYPEAFLTATRQTVSRIRGLPLEQLSMSLTLFHGVEEEAGEEAESKAAEAVAEITIVGLVLHSAELNKDRVCVPIAPNSRFAYTNIPVARLSWVYKKPSSEDGKREKGGGGKEEEEDEEEEGKEGEKGVKKDGRVSAQFPFYLSSDRSVTLGVVSLPITTEVPIETWYKLGTCLTARKIE